MYVAAGYRESRIAASGNSFLSAGGRVNQELRDFTRGFYEAREVAMLALSRQAAALGADGIVGVTIGEDLREREYEDAGKNQRKDLIVHIHVLGTAIREAAPTATPPRQALTILPLRAPTPTA